MKIEVDSWYFNDDLQEKIDKRIAEGWKLISMAPDQRYQHLHLFYWGNAI